VNNIQFEKSALTTSFCAEPPAQACRISLAASDHQASNFPGAAEAKKLNKHRSPPPLAFVSSIGDRVTFLKPVGWSRHEQVTPSCKPKKDPVWHIDLLFTRFLVTDKVSVLWNPEFINVSTNLLY